ncbi:Nif3-like dinuclear metal center hexameric protein [Haloferula sp. A504]|uniref:Nif3-like dinuclear metal center hexameric protein n=1 Tax=Haloferula sp. A504 TaxID=3373601 RepID=UPI0031C0CD59|nr:Nif3-like dinuclear metal center hexameric protein [Verrucomicrobiaceae bacterium E54]
MAKLSEIRAFLDDQLKIAEIPDYPGAVNGLQLAGNEEVAKVIAAVDASAPVIEKAVAAGGDLLLVHHGMFWRGAQPLTGAFYRKIKAAMDAGMAIYSAHLPLDVHPEWGNNARLAVEIGMEVDGGFLDYKGMPVGLLGQWRGALADLVDRVGRAIGGAPHICPAGPGQIGRIGLCTGGAGSQVAEAAEAGIDAFITGEGPHHTYGLAEELGINLIYAGHYATETFGVKALAGALSERFGVAGQFIDHPTGL